MFKRRQLLELLIPGLLLNIIFFIPNLYFQILVFFIISPVFYTLNNLKTFNQRYVAGLIFFGSWIIPTTYWYYKIFPWWQAFAQSVGFVTLLALLFVTPLIFKKVIKKVFKKEISKKNKFLINSSIIIIPWTLLSSIRLILPIIEDWWIPHIGNTQWLNPLTMQFANFGSVAAVIFSILVVNLVIGYFRINKKKSIMISLIVSLSFIFIVGNFVFLSIGQSGQEVKLIGVQSIPESGFNTYATHNDIEKLKSLTLEQLDNHQPTFVVWPENMVDPSEDENIQRFAKENNIYLIYNRQEPSNNEFPYNTAVIINNKGQVISTNYKLHRAPNEKISEKEGFSIVKVNDILTTADICYDLHYPDISNRIKGSDLLLAPVDDARYGYLLPLLHASDVVFRAVENDVNIMTASTNGPTFFVNKYGVVKQKPLQIYSEDVYVINVNI